MDHGTTRASTPPAWARVDAGPVSIGHPEHWTDRRNGERPPGLELLLAPDAAPGRFAPTLVVAVNSFDGTVPQLSTLTLAGNRSQLHACHVLAVDAWDRPVPGRRIEIVHRMSAGAVHAVQLLLAHEGQAVTVTLSCAEADLPECDALFRRMLDEVRWEGGPAVDAPPFGFVPDRDPRFEEFASAQTGRDLEELSGLAGSQPYHSKGPWLAPDTLLLLQRLGDSAQVEALPDGGHRIRGGLGRLELGASAAALAQLESAGLAEPGGALTPSGFTVTTPLREADRSVRFATEREGRTSLLQLWLGHDDGCLVLAGPSALEQMAAEPGGAAWTDRQQIDFLHAGEAPAAVAAWLGIGPAWAPSDGPYAVSEDAFRARRDAVGAAPGGAPEALQHLWGQPWLFWWIESPGQDVVAYLTAGSAGHFRVVRQGGRIVLDPTASRNVYRHLCQILAPAGVRRSLDSQGAAADPRGATGIAG
ncbi:hypothetical protein ACQ3I4_13795 [Zafaria sp. Z1313]|uniref:hypothetical protein n=1 Tax=unclassified Zafaria TaxID=2828765 RepID=UPI002E773D67|nr:hypothetical protein [Zafaria sp. J156]MEE1621849.1 hypothetical protein [Zafaria sp. J156]